MSAASGSGVGPVGASTPVVLQQGTPLVVQVQQSWGLGRRVLLALLAISVLANFGMYAANKEYFRTGTAAPEKYHSLSKDADHKVAVITLSGTIMSGDGFIKTQIDQVRADEQVKAIVLRVVSPGGTISGSDAIYHQLRKLVQEKKIPLVVSMGGIAASGGYYVSMAVGDTPNTIFAEPTTFTGSIGVIIPHYDFSGLMAEWNIKDDSIVSHPLKNAGSPTKQFTPEERALFQSLVDDGFRGFKEVVQSGRPKFRQDAAALGKLATGQIFTARQALDNGLVDKIGFLEDAIERAIELAELSRDDVRVVEYKQPPLGLLDLLGDSQGRAARLDLAALLDMTSPRAYYLCTWLPAIARSERERE